MGCFCFVAVAFHCPNHPVADPLHTGQEADRAIFRAGLTAGCQGVGGGGGGVRHAAPVAVSPELPPREARSVVRDLDPMNDLTFLRIRSKKHAPWQECGGRQFLLGY